MFGVQNSLKFTLMLWKLKTEQQLWRVFFRMFRESRPWMKIYAQLNQWEAKRRAGCNCCTLFLTGQRVKALSSRHLGHLRHQRTDVSSCRLTRGSSRLGKVRHQRGVLPGFSHLWQCVWAQAHFCWRYGSLFPPITVTFYFTIQTLSPLTILGLYLTILTYFLTILR